MRSSERRSRNTFQKIEERGMNAFLFLQCERGTERVRKNPGTLVNSVPRSFFIRSLGAISAWIENNPA